MIFQKMSLNWRGWVVSWACAFRARNLSFTVGHAKFNFPPLYAGIASSGRVPVASFAIETIIAVALKTYHAWNILWRNYVYFSTVTRWNWLQERQKCEDFSADRCFLLSMPYFFVFATAAGTYLLGCWAWYSHKFLQNNGLLLQACHRQVDRDIYSRMHKCYPI